MPSLADFLGAPSAWTFEGVEYQIRPPEQDEEGLFSRHLERRYREWVERSADLPEDRQQKALVAGGVEAAAGRFEWGSDAYVAALGNPATLAVMLRFILKKHNPDKKITDELCRRMVAQKLAEIAAVIHAEAEADPKKAEAALAAVGIPRSYWPSSGTSTSASSTPPTDSPGPNSGG